MNKQQKITIAAMAVVGLLLAAWMLWPEPATQDRDAHAEHGDQAKGKAEGSEPAPAAHADRDAARVTAATIALDAAQIKAAGIVLAVAGPAKISVVTSLPGEIRFNDDRTAHVVPKLAGVVTAVHADLGQSVRQGQVLAVIASSGLSDQRSELLSAQRRLALAVTTLDRERRLWQDRISAEQDYLLAQQAANEAQIAVQNARQKLSAIGVDAGAGPASVRDLNRLELRAPFDGVVMEKHLALGEAVKEDAIVFTLSDLSTVWAEVAVPPKDLSLMRVGETVTIKATAFAAEAQGKIIYVGELLGEQTRTAKARVAVANPDRSWRPGLFVTVDVLSGHADAADAAPAVNLAIAADAVQTLEDRPVVFVEVAGGFRPQPVTLGRSDGKLTEVLQGLQAGARYVAAGSFVLKAELGKDSAGHAH
ncbi:MAG: efflux RND transporter periplasmic adaptor subunit [Duganella sp.]